MRSQNLQDFFIGAKTNHNGSAMSSNLAKYGQMNMQNHNNKPNSANNIRYGDSISNFQQQLQRLADRTQSKLKRNYLQRKKRVYTQNAYNMGEEQYIPRSHLAMKKDSTKQLQAELDQIKRLVEQQSRVNTLQSRFQRLYTQLQKKSSQKMINSMPQIPQMAYPPFNYYPPPPQQYPYYPPNDYFDSRRSGRNKSRDYQNSQDDYNPRSKTQSSRKPSVSSTKRSYTKPMMLPKSKIVSRLKKYFFVVTFISYLKKQSKKLALLRKNNLRKFWLQKFDSQVLNIKNWLLDCLKYSLSIILQKRQLNFNFFNQPREKVKNQKQKLVLKLAYIFVQQMKKLSSSPKDVALFTQILVVTCSTGSFPISRFWTVNQMQKMRISQYFGFIRADSNTQNILVGIFIFIKVLIFNMLLQPFKFDSINFKKDSQPLLSNLYLIGSILYHIVKQVLDDYLNEPKTSDIYEPGNWLKVKKQFLCECCQPLKFNVQAPQKGEYISGMLQRQLFNEMLQTQQNFQKWNKIKSRIKQIIQNLNKQMSAKKKMMKSNLKYKLYN